MGDIVHIDSAKPHTSGPVLCTNCSYEWIGVIPVAVPVVECPECHLLKGIRKGFVYPDEYFTCQHCTGFLFIRPTYGGSLCVHCGQWNED